MQIGPPLLGSHPSLERIVVCGSCGFLLELDTAPPIDDPMRRQWCAEPSERRCPCCHGRAWLKASASTTMREATMSQRPDGWLGLCWLALLPVVTVFLEALGLRRIIPSVWVAAAVVLVAQWCWRGVVLHRRTPLPYRWRVALPTRSSIDRGALRGDITPVGPLLRAPISGRPCVAYEIAVGGRGELAMGGDWMVLEQHSTAVVIAGSTIARDALLLTWPRCPVPDPETAHAWLATRLPSSRRHDVAVFETLILAGESVTLECVRHPWMRASVPCVRPKLAR